MDYEMDSVDTNKKDISDKSIDAEWQIDSEWINLTASPTSALPVNNKKGKKVKQELGNFEAEAPPSFHFISAVKGGKFLVIDNKALRLSQKKATGYSYWVCSIPCCTARCVLDPEEKKIVRFFRDHNHEADVSRQEYKKFINALKIAVKENPHVKPKELYDVEIEKSRERWRENNLKNNTNEEEPCLPTFEAVRTAMYNSRNAVLSAVSLKATEDDRVHTEAEPAPRAGPSRSTRSRDSKVNPKRKSTPSKTLIPSSSDLEELEEEWSSEPHRDADLSDFETWLEDDVNANIAAVVVSPSKEQAISPRVRRTPAKLDALDLKTGLSENEEEEEEDDESNEEWKDTPSSKSNNKQCSEDVSFYFMPSSRGCQVLVIDGCLLHQNTVRSSGKSYWRCQKKSCFFRAVYDPKLNKVTKTTGLHNHLPDSNQMIRRQFINNVKCQIMEHPHIPARQIYEKEMDKVQQELEELGVIWKAPSFSCVKHHAYRARRIATKHENNEDEEENFSEKPISREITETEKKFLEDSAPLPSTEETGLNFSLLSPGPSLVHSKNFPNLSFYFIPSKKGKRILVVNDFTLRLNSLKSGGRYYWKCTVDPCMFRCVYNENLQDLIKVSGKHTHTSNVNRLRTREFCFLMKARMSVDPSLTPKKAYDQEVAKIKSLENGESLVKCLPAYTSIRTSLYNQKHKQAMENGQGLFPGSSTGASANGYNNYYMGKYVGGTLTECPNLKTSMDQAQDISPKEITLHGNMWKELTEDHIAWREALHSGIEASEGACFQCWKIYGVNEKWLHFTIQICQVSADHLHKKKKAIYIYKIHLSLEDNDPMEHEDDDDDEHDKGTSSSISVSSNPMEISAPSLYDSHDIIDQYCGLSSKEQSTSSHETNNENKVITMPDPSSYALSFVPTSRGGQALVVNGCVLRISYTRVCVTYWRCLNNDCSFRCSYDSKGKKLLRISGEHNHSVNKYSPIIRTFVRRVKKRVCQENNLSPKIIYDEEVEYMKGDGKDGELARKLPSYDSLKSALYKAKNKSMKASTSVEHLGDLLLDDSEDGKADESSTDGSDICSVEEPPYDPVIEESFSAFYAQLPSWLEQDPEKRLLDGHLLVKKSITETSTGWACTKGDCPFRCVVDNMTNAITRSQWDHTHKSLIKQTVAQAMFSAVKRRAVMDLNILPKVIYEQECKRIIEKLSGNKTLIKFIPNLTQIYQLVTKTRANPPPPPKPKVSRVKLPKQSNKKKPRRCPRSKSSTSSSNSSNCEGVAQFDADYLLDHCQDDERVCAYIEEQQRQNTLNYNKGPNNLSGEPLLDGGYNNITYHAQGFHNDSYTSSVPVNTLHENTFNSIEHQTFDGFSTMPNKSLHYVPTEAQYIPQQQLSQPLQQPPPPLTIPNQLSPLVSQQPPNQIQNTQPVVQASQTMSSNSESMFTLNGYPLLPTMTNINNIYWQCQVPGCRFQCVFNASTSQAVHISGSHNHEPPGSQFAFCSQVVKMLQRKSAESLDQPLSSVYWEYMKSLRNVIDSEEIMSSLPRFQDVVLAMQSSRSAIEVDGSSYQVQNVMTGHTNHSNKVYEFYFDAQCGSLVVDGDVLVNSWRMNEISYWRCKRVDCRFKCVLDEELQCVHVLNIHTPPCLSFKQGEDINWAVKRKCSDKSSSRRLKIQRIE